MVLPVLQQDTYPKESAHAAIARRAFTSYGLRNKHSAGCYLIDTSTPVFVQVDQDRTERHMLLLQPARAALARARPSTDAATVEMVSSRPHQRSFRSAYELRRLSHMVSAVATA